MDLTAAVFIAFMIIGVTQAVKLLVPEVFSGALTIFLAILIGALVGIFSEALGLDHISIASGIVDGLLAAGIHTAASSVNTKS